MPAFIITLCVKSWRGGAATRLHKFEISDTEGVQKMIDLEKIWQAEVPVRPFEYFVARNVLSKSDLEGVRADFPHIDHPGTFPLQELEYGPAFARLVAELRNKDFTYVVGKKLRINLTLKPLMISVRGHSRATDGRIHTDSKKRAVSCILYLNDEWDMPEGRLRMLKNSCSFKRQLTEILPSGGTFVAIKRSNRSWHGYLPYEGPRRCIVFNWMWSRTVRELERARHRLSAQIKSRCRPVSHLPM